MMTAEAIMSRLKKPSRQSDGSWMACCPAHDDKTPSLSIKDGDKGTVVNCFSGCSPESVVQAMGLTMADLFPDKKQKQARRLVATYDYTDEEGQLQSQVQRFERSDGKKEFIQRRPDGNGDWIYNRKGVRNVPYRFPETLAAVKAKRPIFIAEGEKDCDAIVKLGFCATCNAGGAGKKIDYGSWMQDVDVFIIADKDEPGRKHANAIAADLYDAARVRVLELPDRNGRKVKDAHDWISAGGEASELDDLAQAAPLWTPARGSVAEENTSTTDLPIAAAADIRGTIIEILRDETISPTEQRTRIALEVVKALAIRGQFYFHSERKDFESAMYFDGERKILERVCTDNFKAWLSVWLRINRMDSLFKFIDAEIQTAALSSSHTVGIIPESFWSARPGRIYLSNGDGTMVRITAIGIEEVNNGTDGVLFCAGRTLKPWKLTTPADVFQTCSLFRDAHCDASHGPDLLRAWMYSLPTNPRSKPPLCLVGDIGSGKTRLAKGTAEVFGIPFVAAKVEEEKEGDFWPSIDQGGVFTLDNADTRCKWLADALANAATDGCSQRRKLYTDSQTVILRPRAWVIVTTANPTFASDAGLADRLLVVRMGRRDCETSDESLTDEILAARDGALSHIATTLQRALADTQKTPSGLNARHPDFGAFAIRIGRALSRETEVVTALRNAEADKAAFCLENDTIATALMAFLRQSDGWSGTAAELLPHLQTIDPDLRDRVSSKKLGKRLNTIWMHLTKVMPLARKHTDRNGINVFEFRSAGFAGFKTPFP